MFLHEKQPLHQMRVDRPNPQYAAMLQEQLGGANGELTSVISILRIEQRRSRRRQVFGAGVMKSGGFENLLW